MPKNWLQIILDCLRKSSFRSWPLMNILYSATSVAILGWRYLSKLQQQQVYKNLGWFWTICISNGFERKYIFAPLIWFNKSVSNCSACLSTLQKLHTILTTQSLLIVCHDRAATTSYKKTIAAIKDTNNYLPLQKLFWIEDFRGYIENYIMTWQSQWLSAKHGMSSKSNWMSRRKVHQSLLTMLIDQCYVFSRLGSIRSMLTASAWEIMTRTWTHVTRTFSIVRKIHVLPEFNTYYPYYTYYTYYTYNTY